MEISVRYHTEWGESLLLVNASHRYPMHWTEGDVWRVDVPSRGLGEFFFALVRDGLVVRLEWDNHNGRELAGDKAEVKWIDAPQGCPFPRRHSRSEFDRPGFRGAGVAVPVFSLRSEEDFGIGEFNDLKYVVDWAVRTGLCIIQLLPVNDTTRKGEWADSYPYSPVSSFALHPLYLNLKDAGVREDAAFRKERAALNALPELDYPRVFRAKMARIRSAFEAKGTEDMSGRAFAKFARDNEFWLKEYCGFCAARDGLEPEYYAWMQYHLDRQFSKVASYARSKGVSLKGDLPIGVSADSADAHFHPELFNLDSAAGAPPDFFSTDGQNWGFPTYNWSAMALDNYAWWKMRLRKMGGWFDAFRIDHILGFFRIWEIPTQYRSGMYGHFNPAIPYSPEEIESAGLPVEGLFLPDPRSEGKYQPAISPDTSGLAGWQAARFREIHDDFYYHRNEELWRRNAEQKLPELLSSTGMLACGEDLGMVPDCVPGVMDHWKILSLEMANMDKGRPWPYLSVCATSSHDMQTLRQQGVDDRTAEECRRILQEHFDSDSMLAIFPIQDYLAVSDELRREDRSAERINEPADPHHHWRYRLHLPLSELCSERAESMNEEIRSMVSLSRRCGF